jgi:hypothetical protein
MVRPVLRAASAQRAQALAAADPAQNPDVQANRALAMSHRPAQFQSAAKPVAGQTAMKTGVGDKALHQRLSHQLHDKAGNAKRFDRFVQTNFGVSSSPAVESLRKDVRAGDWRWLPSVQQGQTQGFDGAFVGGSGGGGGGAVPAGGPAAGSKILLNNGLGANQKTATFWEEVGHAMDNRLRGGQGDAQGDEGQMFAQQLLGQDVLPSTRAENDHGTVSVSGGAGLSAEFGIPEKMKLLQETIVSPGQAPDGIYQFTNFAQANRMGAAPRINSNPIAENKYIADVARASEMPVTTIPIGGNPDTVDVFLTTSNGHRVQVLADPNLHQLGAAKFSASDNTIRINSSRLDEFHALRNSLYRDIEDPLEQQRLEQQYPVKFQALDEFARGSIAGNLVHEMSHAEQWQASLQFANYDQKLAGTHYNSWLNTQEYAAHAAQHKFTDAWYAAKELTLDAGGVTLESYPRAMDNVLAPIDIFNDYYSKGYDVERARLTQLTGVSASGLTGQQITDTVTTTVGPSVDRNGIPMQGAVGAGERAGSNAFHPDELSPDAQPAAAGSSDPAYADPVSRTQELGEFDRLLGDRLHPASGQALHEQHVIEVNRIIAGGEAAGASSADIGMAVDSSNKAFATKVAEHIQGAASDAGEALKAVAPLLDVATLGYSIYQDINRGDGLPTETAKTTTGLASAWAGAELGAQVGAAEGPVGAAIGGFVGGVGGYAAHCGWRRGGARASHCRHARRSQAARKRPANLRGPERWHPSQLHAVVERQFRGAGRAQGRAGFLRDVLASAGFWLLDRRPA